MKKTGSKVAFISDVHGNSPALEAVLHDIERYGVDELINLGDIINGMDPQGCVQLLRKWANDNEIKLTCIMGNAEAYLVTPDRDALADYGLEWYPGLLKLINWFQDHLSDENMDWIRSWPMTMRWKDAFLVHDSPLDRVQVETKSNPIIKPEHREWFFHGRGIPLGFADEEWENLFAFLRQQEYKRVFCGHTHEAFIREGESILVCNVGSAGAPLDGDWRPAWVLLETDVSGKEKLTFQRVEYDLSRINQLVDASPDYSDFQESPGKMEAFKHWYATGIHWRYHLRVLQAEEEGERSP